MRAYPAPRLLQRPAPLRSYPDERVSAESVASRNRRASQDRRRRQSDRYRLMGGSCVDHAVSRLGGVSVSGGWGAVS